MQPPNRFVTKFDASMVAVLGCFDRVIFQGYLPFGGDDHRNRFVDHGLHLRRKDFIPGMEQASEALVAPGKLLAEQAAVPYRYLQGPHAKEKIIHDLLREQPRSEGLVAVRCCQETCRTVKLRHGHGRPRLVFAHRPQRVLYFYYLDPDCGLIHLRIQTGFPFTLPVYVNGPDGLARQLLQAKVGFVQHDNAFTQLDDPGQAPNRADRFAQLPWRALLDRWACRVNPLLGQPTLGGRAYRWVIDQAEYSTDLLFRDGLMLAALDARLLDHATLHFSAEDLLTFLGRRLHPRFDGTVLTTCKKDRPRGARVKHRVKNNWLKRYDKFGLVLRIETVINPPRECKVRRGRVRGGRRQLVWCPLNKGVANFYHYHAVARAANQRYLDALAVVNPPSATAKQLDRLCAPVRFPGRRRRGLHPLRREEQRLFFAALRGENVLPGLRNRAVAQQLFGPAPADPAGRRRRTARVSRLLHLLRAHGLIAKIPHAHRYRVTEKGQQLMNAAIYVRYKAFPKELDDVA